MGKMRAEMQSKHTLLLNDLITKIESFVNRFKVRTKTSDYNLDLLGGSEADWGRNRRCRCKDIFQKEMGNVST